MDGYIEEYNRVAREWNEEFGHLFSAIIVVEDDVASSRLGCIRDMFLSDGLTARQKLRNTERLSEEFKSKSMDSSEGEVSRGELALLLNYRARRARKSM